MWLISLGWWQGRRASITTNLASSEQGDISEQIVLRVVMKTVDGILCSDSLSDLP